MSQNNGGVEVAGGGGCLGMCCVLTFVVFLVLKLAEIGVVAGWSWWWVTAPLWGYAAFCLLLLMFIIFLAIVAAIVSSR